MPKTHQLTRKIKVTETLLFGVNAEVHFQDGNEYKKIGVTELEANITDQGTIDDLSQAYAFATVAEFKASLIEFPVGKNIHLQDRKANYLVIAGNTPTLDYAVIFSTGVSQSLEMIPRSEVDFKSFGGVGGGLEIWRQSHRHCRCYGLHLRLRSRYRFNSQRLTRLGEERRATVGCGERLRPICATIGNPAAGSIRLSQQR